jgi:hypothetical protein
MLTPEVARELPPHLQPLAHAILQKSTTSGAKPPGYYEMHENFNNVLWTAVAPAAHELYGNDDVLVNERLSELSREIIRLRPWAYVRWLLPAGKHGVAQLFEYAFLDRPGLLLLTALTVCQVMLIARRRREPEATPLSAAAGAYYFELHAVLLIALAFAAAKLALVILVEPPIHRYVAAAAIFLPMWPALLLINRLNALARNLQ